MLALQDLDPQDARLPEYVRHLGERRDKESGHWGTTESNAHALLALGEFTPKLLCATRPLGRMLDLAPLYRLYAIVFAPFTSAAMFVTGRASEKKGKVKVTPDDLLGLLRDRKNGVRLTDFESALIARILVLRKKGEAVTAEGLLKALDETD